MFKRLISIFSLIAILSFTSCGGGGSDEAKELLQRLLYLVGIPHEIVVNICQDNNNNGFCESIEPHVAITINSTDTVDKLWQKVMQIDNGRYLLETYDANKPILLELQDTNTVHHDNGIFTIPYNGFKDNQTEKELSILQAMVDAKYINIENTINIKNIDGQDIFYEVLLSALMSNYNKLKNNSMTNITSMDEDLKVIANRLLELNIAEKLPTEINACDGNQTCIRRIMNIISERIHLTDEEAYEIARNSRKDELINDKLVKAFTCPSNKVRIVRHYGIEDAFLLGNGIEKANPSTAIQDNYTTLVNYDTINSNQIFAENIQNLPHDISKGLFLIGVEPGSIEDTIDIGKYKDLNSYSSPLNNLEMDDWLYKYTGGDNWNRNIYYNYFKNIQFSNDISLLDFLQNSNAFDVVIKDSTAVDFITTATCSLGFTKSLLVGKTFYSIKKNSIETKKRTNSHQKSGSNICILEHSYTETTVSEQTWTYIDDNNWVKGCIDYTSSISNLPYYIDEGVLKWTGTSGKFFKLKELLEKLFKIEGLDGDSSLFFSKSGINALLEPTSTENITDENNNTIPISNNNSDTNTTTTSNENSNATPIDDINSTNNNDNTNNTETMPIGSLKVKKTGQINSYNQNGEVVTDGTIKDDGYYKKGITTAYSRKGEVVSDSVTGLMWQDNEEAKSITKPLVTQDNYDAKKYNDTTGDTATTYCSNLVLDTFEDWRLPTSTELEDIVDYRAINPSINAIFQNTVSDKYWSSSSVVNDEYNGWFVSFSSGNIDVYFKKTKYHIRCVRN